MFWKLMIMQIKPGILWFRIYLGLCLPAVIYLQNTNWIIALVVLLLVTALLPRPKVLANLDFTYHMVRGLFLEMSGEAKHNSKLAHLLYGSIAMKTISMLIIIGLFGYSIYLLWTQNLLMGSLLFYGVLSHQMCMLSQFSNISKSVLANNKWDILISVDEK